MPSNGGRLEAHRQKSERSITGRCFRERDSNEVMINGQVMWRRRQNSFALTSVKLKGLLLSHFCWKGQRIFHISLSIISILSSQPSFCDLKSIYSKQRRGKSKLNYSSMDDSKGEFIMTQSDRQKREIACCFKRERGLNYKLLIELWYRLGWIMKTFQIGQRTCLSFS